MAPHPIPLPCDLALPPTSHREATTPGPCWVPHFMTPERLMFLNPTPSEPRISPAAVMSNDMLSAPTPTVHCASILQPATPPQVVTVSLLILGSSLLQFVNCLIFAESRKCDL